MARGLFPLGTGDDTGVFFDVETRRGLLGFFVSCGLFCGAGDGALLLAAALDFEGDSFCDSVLDLFIDAAERFFECPGACRGGGKLNVYPRAIASSDTLNASPSTMVPDKIER